MQFKNLSRKHHVKIVKSKTIILILILIWKFFVLHRKSISMKVKNSPNTIYLRIRKVDWQRQHATCNLPERRWFLSREMVDHISNADHLLRSHYAKGSKRIGKNTWTILQVRYSAVTNSLNCSTWFRFCKNDSTDKQFNCFDRKFGFSFSIHKWLKCVSQINNDLYESIFFRVKQRNMKNRPQNV